MLKDIELTEVNESSLLDAYVSFLLGQGEALDRAGSDMDHRRREHLLSLFAQQLIADDRLAMSRLGFEEFVAQYFRNRGWADRLSPGHIADDLIARRVLHESQEGMVGFRHPAFRALFAGKAMIDDSEFAARMVADPLLNANAIRHAAGLKRSDAKLLKDVAAATRGLIAAATDGFDAHMFDLMKARPGWVRENPDLEELASRLDGPVPASPDEHVLDARADAIDDDLDFYEATQPVDRHPLDVSWDVARELARVLRNSELVDDLDLKADVLRAVLDDWSVFIVMAAAPRTWTVL